MRNYNHSDSCTCFQINQSIYKNTFPYLFFYIKTARFTVCSKQWDDVFSQQQDYLKQFTLAVIKEKRIGSMAQEEGSQMLPLTAPPNQNI